MPNAWILQTNAARVDIDRYLTERETAVWGCGKFDRHIAVGDRAFLWRAAGGTKADAGIVGLATVIAPAEYRHHDAPDRLHDQRLLVPKLRLSLRLDEIRVDHPIPRAAVKAHPDLMRHPIVTVNQGAAFALTERQVAALDDLWWDYRPSGPAK